VIFVINSVLIKLK